MSLTLCISLTRTSSATVGPPRRINCSEVRFTLNYLSRRSNAKADHLTTLNFLSTLACGWLGVCGGADYVEHLVGLGKHGDVTALELVGGRFHSLRNKTFQLRVHSAVVLAHNVPARLRLPRRSFKLLVEEVRVWHALGRPNKFLFLLWQISREACDATWLQPHATICDFDVAEDVCARKFILLALRRLVGIRRERSDIDQSGNTVVHPRGCNDCSAVRMTNENGRAAHPSERSVDCRDVALESVETVLGRDHFVPLRLKRWDQLAEARAVGPESVGEYDALFSPCHICLLLLVRVFICHFFSC